MILRLLPFARADGAHNMAADETLLLSAHDGRASLRFYGWTSATVSLGYFQPHAARLHDPRLAVLPWVRRATGGATLAHHHELTYALALPPGTPWQTGASWMLRMHAIIQSALAALGVSQVEPVQRDPVMHGDVLCFQQQTPGDLLARGSKVVGSAQRKHRRALLQHGSILLRQSEFTPMLPGLFELTGRDVDIRDLRAEIQRQFTAATHMNLCDAEWTDAEHALTESLVREKYGQTAWNEKR